MPITQERMLTCINAGLSAFNALELAKQIINEQIANTKGLALRDIPQTDTISILETLQILLTPETLVNTAGPMSYIEAWHQLQMEARHFHEFKSTNARAKRYQQRKRKINTSALTSPSLGTIEQAESLYQQTQNALIQKARDKLNKMKARQATEIKIDYRNYKPEDFE